MKADSKKEIYGLVGHPLGHSFSRNFFTEKFQRENINADYINFDIEDITTLRDIVCNNPAIRGLNVTIPYKKEVMALLDEIDPVAAKIGAVNTIRVERNRDGKVSLYGFNTDTLGFGATLDNFNLTADMHALVLGTGGASLAVLHALNSRGIRATRVSRNPSGVKEISYQQLDKAIIARNRLIINTTPLGTFPNTDACADIPYQFITPSHIALDLVYNPPITKFLANAADRGATIKNGLEMLHQQAVSAWKIWNREG